MWYRDFRGLTLTTSSRRVMMSTIFTKQLGRMASSNVNGPRPLWWRSVWSIQTPTSAKAGSPRWSCGKVGGGRWVQPLSGQRVGCWFFQQVLEVWWFLILSVALGCGGFFGEGVVVVCRNVLEVGCWCCTSKAFKHLLVGMPEGGWLWISNWWRLACFQDVISADFGKEQIKGCLYEN